MVGIALLEKTLVGHPIDPVITWFARDMPADPRTPGGMQRLRGIDAAGVGQWHRYGIGPTSVLPCSVPGLNGLGMPAR